MGGAVIEQKAEIISPIRAQTLSSDLAAHACSSVKILLVLRKGINKVEVVVIGSTLQEIFVSGTRGCMLQHVPYHHFAQRATQVRKRT